MRTSAYRLQGPGAIQQPLQQMLQLKPVKHLSHHIHTINTHLLTEAHLAG